MKILRMVVLMMTIAGLAASVACAGRVDYRGDRGNDSYDAVKRPTVYRVPTDRIIHRAPENRVAYRAREGHVVYRAGERCLPICKPKKPYLQYVEDGVAALFDVPLALISPIACPIVSPIMDTIDPVENRSFETYPGR